MPDSNGLPNCLMVGTGEYTTGFVRGGNATKSDKKCGVVALVMFDLRMRGKIGNRIGIVGTSGNRMPDIRRHLKKAIGDVYVGMNVECETYPKDDIPHDSKAYLSAMNQFERGDIVTIFTPDDTHFEIAMAAIERGLHVMITKPPVKTLEEHKKLIEASRKHNVLVLVEVHKRYDPIYSDARNRIVNLGDFSYLTSYMSQPKLQLGNYKFCF